MRRYNFLGTFSIFDNVSFKISQLEYRMKRNEVFSRRKKILIVFSPKDKRIHCSKDVMYFYELPFILYLNT